MKGRPPWRYPEIDWPAIEGHPEEERLLHAFQMEAKTAVFYVQEGLISLHSLDWNHDFYPAPFQLIASGLERLLKLALVAGVVRESGSPPTRPQLRSLGHGLSRIRDEAYGLARRQGFWARLGEIPDDFWPDFVEGPPLRSEILLSLEEFAKAGRYGHLDRLLADSDEETDPDAIWKRLEEAVVEATADPDAEPGTDEAIPALSRDLIRDAVSGRGRSYLRNRNGILIAELLSLLQQVSRIVIYFAGSRQEGPLRVFLHIRNWGRPPKLWFEWRKPPELSVRDRERIRATMLRGEW